MLIAGCIIISLWKAIAPLKVLPVLRNAEKEFCLLRHDVENFRRTLKADRQFDTVVKSREQKRIHDRLKRQEADLPTCCFITDRLRDHCEAETIKKLKPFIAE